MSYENNNNSQEFDYDRENRPSGVNSREANRFRKNQQIQKNETRSGKHSSSGVSVGMTKPPIKPSFIIAAVTIFLVVVISVIFIIRSLPETPDTTTPGGTTPAVTTPAPTTPTGTTPAPTTPAPTTPAPTTPAPTTPAGTTPAGTTPAGTTPAGTTPAGTTPAPTTPAGTTPAGTTPAPTTPAPTTPAPTTPAPTTPVPTETRDVVYPNVSINSGLLVPVNSANPVVLPAEKIRDKQDPSIYYYEHLPYASFSSYEGKRVLGLREFYMHMTRDTAKALDDMLYDFIEATGGFSAENAVRVGKPLLFKAFDESDLTSEFALGTTIHLKVVDGSSTLTFSEADGYTWIYENAHKYGFVLRYPEGKEELTGEQYNDGIFRYVGVAHATAMHELDMCYEEYVPFITASQVTSPIQVACDNVETGELESYLIYYVPIGEGETTNIPVYENTAEDAITITGDGANGFIVTIKE